MKKQYDSSAHHYLHKTKQKRFWPYTLDYGFPEDVYCDALNTCLTKTFPGLWEIPMQNRDTTVLMNPPITTESMNKFKEEFKKNYESNRAPFGLYVHHQWLAKDIKNVEFVKEFYQWIGQNFKKVF